MAIRALPLLIDGASPPPSNCRVYTLSIRRLIGVTRFLPVDPFQCSTPQGNTRRQPKSCFGENQLLPDSISFSLLTSGHPRVLNNPPVRSSIPISRNFNLPKASSSGFGSISCCILFALLRLAFATPSRCSRLDKQHEISRLIS